DMHNGIKQSCDCYFYECARRTGIRPIAEMCHKFGLGETYGLEIPGEKAGLVPVEEWKRRVWKDRWRDGDSYNIGMGQGALTVTRLQLCVMAARLANGGKAVIPHVIRSFGGRERELAPPEDLHLNPKHVAFVQDGMNAVTNEGGTAARSKLELEGFD